MSRKYMNDRWCVRCGRNTETPYLRKNAKLLTADADHGGVAVDIGCGNGRNSKFAVDLGYTVYAFDMAKGQTCCKDLIAFDAIVLGKDALPLNDNCVNLILANYILMFLNKRELMRIMLEMHRISAAGCKMVIELYPAKDSYTPTVEACTTLLNDISKTFSKHGWDVKRKSKDRMILVKSCA